MDVEELYLLAEKEKINIFNFKMKNKAIIGCYLNNYSIGMNYALISDSREEKSILAEELGHYYCNALYSFTSSPEEIAKKEYRAKKWAFKTLIPSFKLKELKDKGYKSTYEIAEKLEVPEELVLKAYNYYKKESLI